MLSITGCRRDLSACSTRLPSKLVTKWPRPRSQHRSSHIPRAFKTRMESLGWNHLCLPRQWLRSVATNKNARGLRSPTAMPGFSNQTALATRSGCLTESKSAKVIAPAWGRRAGFQADFFKAATGLSYSAGATVNNARGDFAMLPN